MRFHTKYVNCIGDTNMWCEHHKSWISRRKWSTSREATTQRMRGGKEQLCHNDRMNYRRNCSIMDDDCGFKTIYSSQRVKLEKVLCRCVLWHPVKLVCTYVSSVIHSRTHEAYSAIVLLTFFLWRFKLWYFFLTFHKNFVLNSNKGKHF